MWLDEIRDISDVNADLESIVAELSDGNGVIKILRGWRINGEDTRSTKIATSGVFLFRNDPWGWREAFKDSIGKLNIMYVVVRK